MYETRKINAKQMHRMCMRKVGFKYKSMAKKVAKAKEQQYNCKNDIYLCPLCNRWHITVVERNENG